MNQVIIQRESKEQIECGVLAISSLPTSHS